MKTGSLEGELLSKGADTTQNCFIKPDSAYLGKENRTNVNGRLAVEWFFREYFESIGRF